jgi:hypothetical protein
MANEPPDFEDDDEDGRYYLSPDSKCPAPEVHLLGLVVIWFGNLELFLESSIWGLLAQGDDQRFMMAQAVTADMSFGQKVHAFALMFREKGPSSADPELDKLVKLLSHAEVERNKLMHSSWNYSSLWGGRDLMRSKLPRRPKKLSRGFHRMSAEQIEETRKSIEDASASLGLFTMKYIQTPELGDDTEG